MDKSYELDYLNLKVQQVPGPNEKFVILTSINIVVCLILLALAVQSLVRIRRVFGTEDKLMVFSLGSLIASVSFLIIYYTLGVEQQFTDDFFSTKLGL
jgi:hypothetical protein